MSHSSNSTTNCAQRADQTQNPADALPPHQRTRCEVWTRVMGYHRPVSSFNIGKQGEFHERKFFTEAKNPTLA